ncbi:MAG: hypothetical protein WCP34_04790 [Pseudomonadota bacterium]
MNTAPPSNKTKTNPLVYALVVAAIALLVAVYYTPIWWVSLTAPNYPAEAFPDGVRIQFHMNGVFNGCRKIEKREISEEEALDCVHEMDTINHYVGMYPIAAGGVIERAFSPFLVSMLGVMLVGFMIPGPGLRVGVMAVAFIGVAGWMALYFYGTGGLIYQNQGYLSAMTTALDQSAGEAENAQDVSPGQALVARLKREMAKSLAKAQAASPEATTQPGKQRYLDNLAVTFQKDQERLGSHEPWSGSGSQLLTWHYAKSLARYFNNPAEIAPLAARMNTVAHAVFWALIGAMVFLVWGARKNGGLLYWLLVLVPLALPLFFLIDYSAWLWWYGHRLNDMGAFTVKPFMPTVFGDGKVAQFSTHSYPSAGFVLMLATSALLAVAALLRRQEWNRP